MDMNKVKLAAMLIASMRYRADRTSDDYGRMLDHVADLCTWQEFDAAVDINDRVREQREHDADIAYVTNEIKDISSVGLYIVQNAAAAESTVR